MRQKAPAVFYTPGSSDSFSDFSFGCFFYVLRIPLRQIYVYFYSCPRFDMRKLNIAAAQMMM